MSKEKKNAESEFCVISREMANSRLKYLTENESTKNVLDEYFMWIRVLQSGVNIIKEDDIAKSENAEEKSSN